MTPTFNQSVMGSYWAEINRITDCRHVENCLTCERKSRSREMDVETNGIQTGNHGGLDYCGTSKGIRDGFWMYFIEELQNVELLK